MQEKSFAKEFKEWRVNKGLSQRKAANMLGISEQTIVFWEAGKRVPSALSMAKVKKFMNQKKEVVKMEMKFRDLQASEIDVRVATVSDKGCSLLLYKDARVDMDILDETVGAMNWQRSHSRENANCIISIWDSEKLQWISKEDTGTESFTEKEKGLASDSFKRSAFNWGIGRELYTAPFIWVKNDGVTLVEKNGKKSTYDKFTVEQIIIENKKIVALAIKNVNLNKRVFVFDSRKKQVLNGQKSG